jgi:hypothetical protein
MIYFLNTQKLYFNLVINLRGSSIFLAKNIRAKQRSLANYDQIMTFGHQIIKFGQASHRAMWEIAIVCSLQQFSFHISIFFSKINGANAINITCYLDSPHLYLWYLFPSEIQHGCYSNWPILETLIGWFQTGCHSYMRK